MKKRFEFLEHTADVYVAAYGESLEEAFGNAALALFEVMTDVEGVKPMVEDVVEVEAHDEFALLYGWLEELLVRFEVAGNVYCRFEVLSIMKADLGLRLRARIWGEPFDLGRHVQKVGVKAVTYHRMEVLKKRGAVTVKFILDI